MNKMKGFFAGIIFTLIFSVMIMPAFAAGMEKTITVTTGVNVYLDDVKLNPTDSNGNPVEVFMYNGTTYLPVRAIANAIGKDVNWDANTQSVYLGKHASTNTTNNYTQLAKDAYKELYSVLKFPSTLVVHSIYGGYSNGFAKGKTAIVLIEYSASNNLGGNNRSYFYAWYNAFGTVSYETKDSIPSYVYDLITLNVDEIIQ